MSSTSGSTNIPLILKMVQESTGIVDMAGTIVRKVLRSGNLAIVDKGIDDLQTKADRCSQTYIIQELNKRFPSAIVIGEEGNISESLEGILANQSPKDLFPDVLSKNVPEHLSKIQESEVVIWVDPLDGTGEFTKGLISHVTILVGIAHKGSPIAGIIHQPFPENDPENGRTMWGIPGVGYGGFHPIPPPKNERVVTTTSSHSNQQVEAALSILNPDRVLRVGGAGHKALLLLEGKANAYVFASKGCKKWDTCAPEAILAAAGGHLTDMAGKSYEYSKNVEHVNERGLLATAPGEKHSWFVEKINEGVLPDNS